MLGGLIGNSLRVSLRSTARGFLPPLALKTNLVICEKGVSSNCVAKGDLDDFGHYVANLIIKDNKLADRLVKDSLVSADKLFETITLLKNKDNFTGNNLLELKKRFYEHIPPHFSIKKVIDYLPVGLQKRFSSMFTEVRIKTEELDIFNRVDSILKKYTNLIAKKVGYPLDLTEFLTVDEILTFIEKNMLPSKKELIERSHGMAIFYKGDRFSLIFGKEYVQFQRILVDTDKTEFKGTVGYHGIAKGKARIVFDPKKIKEFNKGDILITGMTRPEFLPLMEKASAFVTDAGGMLSHAAIVARELKKPCVLATENATKIIKDGDEIEVDANMGIVRILKKN